ncbi:PREDICTED: taste receptor type 2 member 9-like [Nanorana parkeri]|uniref:taste receptor type 2 member 9-like n=1 Tax=Nanorana parkeri TaxID=125878 RepID=UPI000853F4C6|nr:PREDICTED: taste receptor type 2 member 9-like [Nanorana parkeri]
MPSHATDFSLSVIFGALLFAECLVGIAINTFIVAVEFMKWKALRSLDTCNKILMSLGIARCCLLYNTILYYSIYLFYPWLLSNIITSSVFLVQTVFLYNINLWITGVLSVFYCVKITSYNHKVFIFMKTRISRLVPLFLVASLLLSIALSLPFGWYALFMDTENLSNSSSSAMDIREDFQFQNLMFFLGSFTPFLILCGAVYLLIRSLRRHTRHMKRNGTSFQNLNLEAHFTAVKSMALLLFFHVMYYISPMVGVDHSDKLCFSNLTFCIRDFQQHQTKASICREL